MKAISYKARDCLTIHGYLTTPYWAPMRAMFSKRVGDIDKKGEMLKSPLLVGQGANDPRVKQAESAQIVNALRKAGKNVEYIHFHR